MNGFKSGDVVVHPKYGRGIVRGKAVGWVVFEDRDKGLPDVAADLRRLVVIDPEDHEWVERLTTLWNRRVGETTALQTQTALREFANPKPPKPEEPTGIGAVVEDSSGHKWVHARHHATDDTWWRCSRWGGWAAWADIDAVSVISEGVQP